MQPGLITNQASRFGALIKGAFGAKGPSALPLVPFITPSLELTNDRPDLAALKGEFLWSAAVSGTSAAAQFPTVWLGTKDTSIMVVEQLVLQSATAQRVRARMTTTAMPGAPVGVEFDDKRVLGGRFSGQGVFSSEAAAIVANRFDIQLQANVAFILPVKWILIGQRVDGSIANVQIQGQTALTDLFVSARGYGRQIDPAELQP